jgi:hypothetical protein
MPGAARLGRCQRWLAWALLALLLLQVAAPHMSSAWDWTQGPRDAALNAPDVVVEASSNTQQSCKRQRTAEQAQEQACCNAQCKKEASSFWIQVGASGGEASRNHVRLCDNVLGLQLRQRFFASLGLKEAAAAVYMEHMVAVSNTVPDAESPSDLPEVTHMRVRQVASCVLVHAQVDASEGCPSPCIVFGGVPCPCTGRRVEGVPLPMHHLWGCPLPMHRSTRRRGAVNRNSCRSLRCTHHRFADVEMCNKGLRSITPCISSNNFTTVKTAALAGAAFPGDTLSKPRVPVHAPKAAPQPITPMQTSFVKVVNEVVEPFGEVMPHMHLQAPYDHDVKREQVLLPNALFTDKTSLYQFLKSSCPDFPKIGYSYFMKLWDTFFWYVDIKSWNPFAKCHECVSLRSMWLSANTDQERTAAKQKQQSHRQQVSFLRKRMDMRAQSALDRPDLVGMYLMDGMDSNKTSVPCFK